MSNYCAPHAGEVHLWHFPTAIMDEARLAAETYLDQNEMAQLKSFVVVARRDEFLTARFAIRTILSRYFSPIRPDEWKFDRGQFGKPRVLNCPIIDLEFNLSHSQGHVVCAITRGHAVGIDLESADRQCDLVNIAKSHFAPDEIAELLCHRPEHLSQRFFEIWTLKEAYIKARGMGLSLPLNRFSFHVPASDCPIGIRFALGFQDNPGHWHFHLAKISGLQMAVALHDPKQSGQKILYQNLVTAS
jgi:4'-phosphopantetheinyl transferase